MRKTGNIEAIYPLSPLQEGILFYALYTPGTMGYLEQFSYTLEGELNVQAFERAWQQVVTRHPILRTLFTWEKRDQPLQIVRQKVPVPFTYEDWRAYTHSEQQSQLEAFLISDRELGFTLSKAPLMRLALIRLDERLHQFTWCFHHLLLDGWSGPIVLSEFFTLYESICKSETPKLPIRRPYRDFIAWLQKQDLTRTEPFWRTYLSGLTKPTPFGVDKPKSKGRKEAYSTQEFSLSENQTNRLKQFAQRQHLTMSTLIEGVWAIILSRYSNEQDVVLGATVSGRAAPLEDIENMVGVFINTLPLRVRVMPEELFPGWLKSLQARQAEMQIYEHCPLTHIQKCSDLPTNLPLFESILVIENYPIPQQTETEQYALRICHVRTFEQTNYPLTNQVNPATSLLWQIRYDRSRFDDETIERMIGHIQTLLVSIATDPHQPIGDLAWLTKAERQQLLVDWNDTRSDYPKDKCIHELFEAQVERKPDNIAVISDQGQLSYAELNKKANQLARYLQHLGVGPNDLVGLSMARNLDMVVAIIGILKAGSAYVPIDASYPEERIAFMLEDSAASVLLTVRSTKDKIPQKKARLICIDSHWTEIKSESEDNLECTNTPMDRAYINYTSGSTGRPKGVEIPHLGVTRLVVGNNYAKLNADNTILHLSTISFDASTLELWGSLLHGAKCVLCPADLPTPSQLADVIKRFDINFMWLTASYFNVIIDENADALTGVKQLLTGGEALSVKHVQKALTVLKDTRLINGYGPTENTTFTCCYSIPSDLKDGLSSIPIGRPIKNTRVYILNQQMQPVPIGVVGELHIGGDGLALGYFNRADLTKEKFFPDPFCDEPGARIYKTGDLVRYLPDGNIEFVGRMDHQVKIRGFRIELGEIEAILETHPAVMASVIDIRTGTDQTKHLLAYVVSNLNSKEFVTGLRVYLQAKLPDYMIPSFFIVLDEMPLTANGKIDRNALPEPDFDGIGAGKRYVAPRNQLEKKLASIWSKHLNTGNIGVNDNFFDLGGDSLLALRLISKIKNETGLDISLSALFDNPTIENITKCQSSDFKSYKNNLIIPVQPAGNKAPLFLVMGTANIRPYLSDDQPIFKFQSNYDNAAFKPTTNSVEEIAAEYIAALKVLFPKGPYIFFGYSFGGLIATEMAHQLKNEDDTAVHLFLIEPTLTNRLLSSDPKQVNNPGNTKPHRRIRIIKTLFHEPLNGVALISNSLRHRVFNFIPLWMHELFNRMIESIGLSVSEARFEIYVNRLHNKFSENYTEKIYDGSVAICHADNHYYKHIDWSRKYKGKIKVYKIQETQDHRKIMLDNEIVKVWVKYLNLFLDSIKKQHSVD